MKQIKHISIGKWLNNNKFVAALSLVLAVVIWLVVALQMGNQTETTFSDIPVSVDMTIPDKLSLKMYGQKDPRVNVTVSGKRYEISSAVLSSDDFLVTVSTASVSAPGKYTLPITVRPKDANRDFQIVNYTPASVEIFFDKEMTENFPVVVEVSRPEDQIAADGYATGELIYPKEETTITGAATEVSKIDRVVATVKLDKPLSETKTFNTSLAIVNKNEGVVSSTYVEFADNNTEMAVTIPIYKLATVRPTVLFKNQPGYFKDHPISYFCSPSDEMNVGFKTWPEGTGTTESRLTLGTIDFSEIKAGMNSFDFTLEEDNNILIVDKDKYNAFRVTFSLDGFETRRIAIPTESIVFKELPEGVRAAIPEQTLEVTVIGLPDEIGSFTAQDVTLTVDASALTEESETAELPVTFSMKTTTSCWVNGSYTVPVTVS